MNLQKQFEKETGKPALVYAACGWGYERLGSKEYVEWLENKN
jgi:hypothetical protein